MKKKRSPKRHRSLAEYKGLAVIALLLITGGAFLAISERFAPLPEEVPETTQGTSVYSQFLLEDLFDTLERDYWQPNDEAVYTDLFGRALALHAGVTPPSSTRSSLLETLEHVFANTSTAQAIALTKRMAGDILQALPPEGRNDLYTEQKEKSLWDNVKNIDDSTDLYEEIDVDEEASTEEIKEVIEETKDEVAAILESDASTEGEKQAASETLAKVERAEKTLTNDEQRVQYNTFGTESTVYVEKINDDVVYSKIKIISPFTFQEFIRYTDHFPTGTERSSLIIDLRGNVGGYIDILPHFLAPFVGHNQLAYEWYSQEEYTPFHTDGPLRESLAHYRTIIVLIDSNSQSSAEVIAASLKRLNKAIIVGVPSRGWGTVERVFPVTHQFNPDETYSFFLVHSLTIRPSDRQPIEGRGVTPHVNVMDADWQDTLRSYYPHEPLIDAVENLY